MKLFGRVLLLLLLLVVIGGSIFYFHPLWVADQQLHFRLWRKGLRGHYVNLSGGRVHYYEAGDTNGIPLVLVHGLGARGEDWQNMVPGLAAQGFHVYAPDLLGYGRSDKPKMDYSIGAEENVVLEFMQAMHLDHADVGGWSMGGWIATQLTLDHPERVDKLAIYDSAGLRFVPDFKQELFTPDNASGVYLLLSKLYPHPRTVPDFVMRDLLQKIHEASPIVGNSMADMMNGHELLDDRLSQMSRPMLIVWGEKDGLIPLSVGAQMHKLVPTSQMVVIPECGHMAPLECAIPVLDVTVKFLQAK